MKEFKYYGEITEYVELPAFVCETQKEMVKAIADTLNGWKEIYWHIENRIKPDFKKSVQLDREWFPNDDWRFENLEKRLNKIIDDFIYPEDETSIHIIYKDGSTYHAMIDETNGKFKRYGIKAAVIETAYDVTVFGDFAITDDGRISVDEDDIEEYGVYNGQYDVKEEPEATAETVESVEETTVSETETVEETAEQETELNAEVAEVEAEQTAEPETFSYEFNEIHKITILKRNNVYVEEFFEKMGGSYVKLGEKTWGCIEDIEEYYGIKINRNVQTDTEEMKPEINPTAENITVSETNQGNINVLIVADIANTFEMITHTGYFDTS